MGLFLLVDELAGDSRIEKLHQQGVLGVSNKVQIFFLVLEYFTERAIVEF